MVGPIKRCIVEWLMSGIKEERNFNGHVEDWVAEGYLEAGKDDRF